MRVAGLLDRLTKLLWRCCRVLSYCAYRLQRSAWRALATLAEQRGDTAAAQAAYKQVAGI